ncbi:hypothetical protein E0K83_09365 [Gramella sp. BOM4]|nr:hypothetical protein [Christiangramia bathymodioli]
MNHETKNKIKKKAKDVAKKSAKLWGAKKGAQFTGSLLKWGAIAGVGYLGYKIFRKNYDHSGS